MSPEPHLGIAGRRRGTGVAVAALLTIHVFMLGWVAARSGPTLNEPGHLAAGLYIVRYGRFDLYPVNPPLVKCLAALPVNFAGPATNWNGVYSSDRAEGLVAENFVAANGGRAFWLITLARWGCLPLSLVGGYTCFRWARDLYGTASGLLALLLWCVSPGVIAHASLITADAGAAALGAAGSYLFWRWLNGPSWPRVILAGVALGLTELTKMTWLILFALWPALSLLWTLSLPPGRRGWARRLAQLAAILLIGLYVLNAGYGFEGSFRRLGRIDFASEFFGGSHRSAGGSGNRFAGRWLGEVPVPLPEKYVTGFDLQRRDFEAPPEWSYLRGEHRGRGWWYYYLYGLAVKEPLGVWVLGLLALGVTLTWPSRYSAGWRHETVLLAPAALVLAFVSSQTAYTSHVRYVLPALPFALIWVSKVARCIDFGQRGLAAVVSASTLWAVGSSLAVYPHSLSYFNELVGGPTKGHYHLIHSNIDWGQDLRSLRDWSARHPEARPLYVDCIGDEFLDRARLGARPVPSSPEPGWYALSVHRLHDPQGKYDRFMGLRPSHMIGYSIYIYHVEGDDRAGPRPVDAR